jgi:dolichol-phosphate mannosyltransferase
MLSIVTPTYNEAPNVDPFIQEVSLALDGLDYEILFVDDDSPDLTWLKVEQIAEHNSRVRVLRRTRSKGLASAVKEGFCEAHGDVVACMDADLQHNPAILPRMLQELAIGTDLVVGSRYVSAGGTPNWNWCRKCGSSVATGMARFCIGVRLTDPMSGFFMLRRRDFLSVAEKVNAEGFKILLEIVAKMKPKKVSEVPLTFRPRVAGISKLTSRIVLQYIHQLWRLSWDRWRAQLRSAARSTRITFFGQDMR